MPEKSLDKHMIEVACQLIGNALGILACGDDEKIARLDYLFSVHTAPKTGTTNEMRSLAHTIVVDQLNRGFDVAQAAHYQLRSDQENGIDPQP